MTEDVKAEVQVRVSVELTPEEIEILREVARDRIAVSRVWRMAKNIALGVTAILAGWVAWTELVLEWIKAKV